MPAARRTFIGRDTGTGGLGRGAAVTYYVTGLLDVDELGALPLVEDPR
jgi:hypothetical protein